jgi:biotin carboxyl carrier protein
LKRFKVMVNDNEYLVKIEPLDDQAGAEIFSDRNNVNQGTTKPTSSKEDKSLSGVTGSVLEAPLRGSILSVLVQPGERVKAGQVLLTLEALKLENEITAPYDAVVEKVLVGPREQVDLGDALLTLKSE